MTRRRLLGVVGILWTVASLSLATLGALASTFYGDAIGATIFYFGLAGAGVAMTYHGFKGMDPDQLSVNAKERLVLKAARANQGEMTVEELSVDTDLSVQECKTILDKLAESGSCDACVGLNFETIYVFREFLPDGRASRSLAPIKGDVELEFAELQHAEKEEKAEQSRK